MKIFFFILCLPVACLGAEIFEDFSTTKNLDAANTTAIWNVAKKRVQVPYAIDRDENDAVNAEDEVVDIGTGKDGLFDPSTQNTFDVNGGTIPSLVTLDSSRVYEFTTFTLAGGTTLRGTGTSPLRIRVQGLCTISGTIDLRGGNASNATAGSASCGGASGGNGGAGTDGSFGNGVVFGSGGGRGSIAGNGGGGGAGHTSSGITGSGGAFAGAPGSAYAPAFVFLDPLQGGSGGGGGAGNPGGGGGGGGGAFSLACGDDVLIPGGGSVRATGGVGANSAQGAGGGGSGGLILILSGGDITNNGVINAQGGAPGVGTVNNGGAGSDGRVRLVDKTADAISSNPPIALPNLGIVVSSTKQPYTVAALPFALEGAKNLDAVENVDNGAGITYDTSKQGETLSELRWRATLQALSPSNGPEIQSFKFTYSDPRKQFNYKISGCNAVHSDDRGNSLAGISFTLLFLLYLVGLTRWGRRFSR